MATVDHRNILFIMSDDIGWFNVSCYNHGIMGYRTPNIDRIAAEGAVWDDDGSLAHPAQSLADKVMSAEEAAALIEPGSNVGMSGFTGAGYPKAVPTALARRITEASARGERFKVGVWTGASTAPELDGALASVDGIDLRMPYQSDPVSRAKINAGRMDYLDMHLSHVAQMVWQGYFGHWASPSSRSPVSPTTAS